MSEIPQNDSGDDPDYCFDIALLIAESLNCSLSLYVGDVSLSLCLNDAILMVNLWKLTACSCSEHNLCSKWHFVAQKSASSSPIRLLKLFISSNTYDPKANKCNRFCWLFWHVDSIHILDRPQCLHWHHRAYSVQLSSVLRLWTCGDPTCKMTAPSTIYPFANCKEADDLAAIERFS